MGGLRIFLNWNKAYHTMDFILWIYGLHPLPEISSLLPNNWRIALCICLPNLRGDHQMALSLALKRLVSSSSLLSRSLNPLLRPAASAASSSVFDVVDRRSDRPLDHRLELSCFPGSIGVCR
ncbi:uncharacterized protein LOC113780844 [Coffea eugenioides]|uniref:uncharacterized protein LOC113760243 n=1 Tax=Coffea eugenioides TaxID=49369 RepID=UPI000F60524A|nr:uncharacterized protein LOC113760243 [Coffea eugenioides]XP_027165916.1 uncharacterized protein LOC113765870 [Coffea eugenioides]XP_027182427.1 uncharacterized protein LOC113780844 [Coffea eugenioides]